MNGQTYYKVHFQKKVCIDKLDQTFDNQWNEIASYLLEYGSPIPGICVPKGMWHTCECLEPGSVIFESKNGRYDPLSTEESLFKLELLGKGGKDAEESSRIGF